jgi:hypothetical protein
MDTFIVGFWARVFSVIRWVSLFHPIYKSLPKRMQTYGFVDAWVIGNSVLSVIALLVAEVCPKSFWAYMLVIYGILRIFEVVTYQVNVVFFDAFRKPTVDESYQLRGYRRILILSIHNYIEILFWFAAIYANWRCLFGPSCQDKISTFLGALYFSIVTMATLGYGDIYPENDWGRLIVIFHLAVAVFMTVLILARSISFLPKPHSMDAQEKDGNGT